METNRIYQGDARSVLRTLPSGWVDMSISSPPYWGLRDYGVAGQLGQEPTFERYLRKLVEIYREVHRVLKPTGACWVVLGDTYMGSGQGWQKADSASGWRRRWREGYGKRRAVTASARHPFVQPKSLSLVPFRFATAMVHAGWILRNTIVWHKPNCMPASVKDRFTVDFEYVFFFVKQQRYYFEQQREPLCTPPQHRGVTTWRPDIYGDDRSGARRGRTRPSGACGSDPAGRNKRCVWTIPPRPLQGAHFAVYPEALLETPIKATCPPGGVVLDPFLGSGTTAVVARRLGRKYLGIELNPAYVQLARDRLERSLARSAA